MAYTLLTKEENGEWVCWVKETPTMQAFGKTKAEAMANITKLILEGS